MINVKIKKLAENAVIPSYAKEGDAGLDLVATSASLDEANRQMVYGTDLAIEIPEGYVGLIYPRSSVSKKDLALSNSVGVIDSGYRGEILFKFNLLDHWSEADVYSVGDRIGQIIITPYPKVQFQEVEELSSTERGNGGYGSSGN